MTSVVVTHPLKLAFVYFRFYFLSTVRNIPALFFTVIFPTLIFLLSAHIWGEEPIEQRNAYLTFANYSVQTVSFMLLGLGVSQERNSNWAKYVRTLPAPIYTMVIGRILHTIVLALLNVTILTLIALVLFNIPLNRSEILCVFAVCAFGAIPFALMGITVGYAASQDTARSIFTLLNLLFLFGSFGFTQTGVFYKIQEFILSYQWVVIQKRIFDPNISLVTPLMTLFGYILVLSFLLRYAFKSSKTDS